jgi:hypothetical protein
MRVAQKPLGVPTFGRGVPGKGLMVEGAKGVKYAHKQPGMYKNGKKQGVSLAY